MQDIPQERQATPACAEHRPILWLADRPAATILGADDDDVWRRRLAMVVEELTADGTGCAVPPWDQWYDLALRCRALRLAGDDRVLVAPAAATEHATGPLHELLSFPAGEVLPPFSPRPEELAQFLVRVRDQLQAAHATVRQVGAGLSPLAGMGVADSAGGFLSDAHFAVQHAADTIERASRYLQASVCALGEGQTAS